MTSVFISYSWKDQDIAKEVIVPLLRDHGVNCFIDYEHWKNVGMYAEHFLEQPIQQSLARLYRTTAFKPWERSTPKGDPIRWLSTALEREIASRDVFLVLMSQFASKSFWVRQEVDFSISLCHKILVVRLDNALLPDRLMTLVNSGRISCVRFTGEDDTPLPSSYEDYIQGLFSSGGEKSRRASTLTAKSRHGVIYRKPTGQDKARLVAELNTLLASPSFTASQVSVREDEFLLSGVPFQFVTISGAPYFSRVSMLKYPVTVQQFALYDPAMAVHQTSGSKTSTTQEVLQSPIRNVTWDEAKAFCKWLSRQTGHNIRLPYEVEWEFACRAGSATKYCFGDDESLLNKYAWYDDLAYIVPGPHVVGAKRPNRWGLYDMHGNVGEWCADVLDVGEMYSMQTPDTHGKIRVFRGGAGTKWMPADTCRSGARHFDTPDSRHHNRGFRLFWRQTQTRKEKSHE